MKKIQLFNNISAKGLAHFPEKDYQLSQNETAPDAILLRSHNLHEVTLQNNLLAVARAGAGVNNIPVEKLTAMGVPVFNTPGANANAVKELVLSGILLASRNICQAWQYVQQLTEDGEALEEKIEAAKKQFVGFELTGRTLGVVGLGAIGVLVANAAIALGMRVIGFDPAITVQNSWQLSASVERAESLEAMLKQVDFLTFHVPLNPHTENLLNAERLQLLHEKAVVLNFSRDGIVDNHALLNALNANKLLTYVCDFPQKAFQAHPKVLALPHLGASTAEAEENCAEMAVQELREYLEQGNIINSVNFPRVRMSKTASQRIAIVNQNVPNMVSQISKVLADQGINIIELINKSRDSIAYTMLDINDPVSEQSLKALAQIAGVIRVRLVI